MKTVAYQGQEFQVPDQLNYIAADPDGTVWVYTNEPKTSIEDDGDYWANGEKQQVGKLNLTSHPVQVI